MSLDSLSSNTKRGNTSSHGGINRIAKHSPTSNTQIHTKQRSLGSLTLKSEPISKNKRTDRKLDNTLLAAIITDIIMSPIVVISTTFSNLFIIALFVFSLLQQQSAPLVAAELLLIATYFIAVPIGVILAIRQLLRKL